jgi:hypothetical protein
VFALDHSLKYSFANIQTIRQRKFAWVAPSTAAGQNQEIGHSCFNFRHRGAQAESGNSTPTPANSLVTRVYPA